MRGAGANRHTHILFQSNTWAAILIRVDEDDAGVLQSSLNSIEC